MTNQLSFSNLEVGYGRKSVLENVSGSLRSGQWVHLFGTNGSGKTSLLQVLASLNHPLSGTVKWNDEAVHKFKSEFRSRIRYFGHEVALYERLTVRDNWELFKGLFDIAGSAPRSLTENISPASEVEELSRGQKRRVELASLIASPRDLVFLDEPLASLDQHAADSLVENLHGIQEDGVIIVTASPGPMDHSDVNWKITDGSIVKVS
jgi:heme exporter protein A